MSNSSKSQVLDEGLGEPRDSERRQQLVASFGDRESRAAYAEGFLHTWIASQFAAVRQQRGLTQKALAELIGTQQPGIARIEREDYGRWNLETLVKIAQALDCRLKVSLESYGSLIREILEFKSPAYLLRPDFEHDPAINLKYADWPGLDAPGPLGMMRRKVSDWVDRNAPVEELQRWLSGDGLPPVGDDTPPSVWIADALDRSPKVVRDAADQRLSQLIFRLRSKPEVDWEEADRLLLDVVRRTPNAERFEKPLVDVVESRRGKAELRDLTSVNLIALLEATAHNQTNTHRCSHLWTYCIGQEQEPRRGVDLGLKGMALIPASPNALEVVTTGLKQVQKVYLAKYQRNYESFVVDRLVTLGKGLGPSFQENLHSVVIAQDPSEVNLRAVKEFEHRMGFSLPKAFTRDSDFVVSEWIERFSAAA